MVVWSFVEILKNFEEKKRGGCGYDREKDRDDVVDKEEGKCLMTNR